MSTYRESDVEIPPGLPLGPAQIAAAYDFVPRDIGELPFGGHDLITRSLWLVRVGEWGIYTKACLPVDDRLDLGDAENVRAMCGLMGDLIRPSLCHDDEVSLVILRRPAPADPSSADEHVFRLIREATVGHETGPWAFFTAGPDGARELAFGE